MSLRLQTFTIKEHPLQFDSDSGKEPNRQKRAAIANKPKKSLQVPKKLQAKLKTTKSENKERIEVTSKISVSFTQFTT